METTQDYKITGFWIWVKRGIYRLWKKIDKDDVLSEVNRLGFDIFKITLNDDNNIKFLSPKSSDKMYIVNKQYVIDKNINTFIVFQHAENGNSKLTIVNHDYRYDFEMPGKTSDIMKDLFEDKVEEDRNKMEVEIMSNITASLEIVLADFKIQLEKGLI